MDKMFNKDEEIGCLHKSISHCEVWLEKELIVV